MKMVKVDIWLDYVCLWCWIVKKCFEKVVDVLVGQVQVEVIYKVYCFV